MSPSPPLAHLHPAPCFGHHHTVVYVYGLCMYVLLLLSKEIVITLRNSGSTMERALNDCDTIWGPQSILPNKLRELEFVCMNVSMCMCVQLFPHVCMHTHGCPHWSVHTRVFSVCTHACVCVVMRNAVRKMTPGVGWVTSQLDTGEPALKSCPGHKSKCID